MRLTVALLLLALTALLGACGSETGDLIPPDVTLDASSLVYLQAPTNATTVHLSGTTEPEATLETVVYSAASVVNLVNVDGHWSFDLINLSEGVNYVILTVNDPRGNYNSLTLAVTYDSTPPAATIDQYLSPTASDNQIIAGTVEAGATVAVTVSPTATAAVVEVNSNYWSCDLSGLADGEYLISVTATDAPGNSQTITRTIIINSSAPLLTVDPVARTQATSVTLTGSSAPGSTVTVTPPSGVTAADVAYDTTDPAVTTWSCELSNLASGNNVVGIALYDGSGIQQATAGTIVVQDTGTPLITAVTPLANYTASAADVNQVTATFHELLDSATVNEETFFLVDALGNPVAGEVSYAVINQKGVASFQPETLPLADGVYTVTLTTSVTDLLGNPLTLNTSWNFTIKAP